ncbi:precorrin-3B C(17)-methyltransferase [Comamonas guangdongensis]|uniref:Precorrin-3B C(17)-methyltransferase n=1 Tax=Comamonas guangdongensis TaxID=510515 RepID=A0ABV3ZXS2_9BURK
MNSKELQGQLCVVGLGPGDDALLTQQVRASIASATDAFGYFPYVERLQGLEHLQLHASDNREELERACSALNLAAQGRKVLMLSSGDPGVFAMASAVFEVLEQACPEELARWQAVDVQVQPGITAMLAAAARLGAPLGHDFCTINLSDNLKPAQIIEHRIRLAAQADFAMAFYNPCSRSRPEGFVRALRVLQQECEPGRLICFARNVSRPDESLQVVRLEQASADMADMRTLVIVGSSQTRRVGKHVYTPRSYGVAAHA